MIEGAKTGDWSRFSYGLGEAALSIAGAKATYDGLPTVTSERTLLNGNRTAEPASSAATMADSEVPYNHSVKYTPVKDTVGFKEELIKYPARNELTSLQGGRSTAINRAWVLEKQLLQAGRKGTHDWSKAEIELILNTKSSALKSVMSNKGYTGHHINSVEGNGSLGAKWQGDPRNIRWVKNGKHPEGVNEHVHGDRGHRGNTQNSTQGRLIDRKAMLEEKQSQN